MNESGSPPSVQAGGRLWAALVAACRSARSGSNKKLHTDHILFALVLRGTASPEIERPAQRHLRRSLRDMAGSSDLSGDYPLAAPSTPYSEAEAALREAWWASAKGTWSGGKYSTEINWSSDSLEAVMKALGRAGSLGIRCAGPAHLLEAILSDPRGPAASLLNEHGVDLKRAIQAAYLKTPIDSSDEPNTPVVNTLRIFRVIPGSSAIVLAFARVLTSYTLRLSRLGAVQLALEHEAIRQAVRVGAERVTTAHLLFALLALDEQLEEVQVALPERVAMSNRGGAILRTFGVSLRAVPSHGTELRDPGPVTPRHRRRLWRSNPRNPPWTAVAANAADRAPQLAGGGPVGSTALLQASLAESGGAAALLLRSLGVEPDEVLARTKQPHE